MSRGRQAFYFLCALLALLSQPVAATVSDGIRQVNIGVLAKRGEEKVFTRWQATADYLSEALSPIHFRIVPMAFDEIPMLVKNRLVDFVIVNSAIFVELSLRYRVRPILTLNNRLTGNRSLTRFGSVVLARADRPDLQQLTDAAGQRVAAVHRTSLGGWIMADREFRKAGVTEHDLQRLRFLDTHDAVVRDVLEHRSDIGIVRSDTLERMSKEGKIHLDQLKTLNPRRAANFPMRLSTPLYPEWPLGKVAHTSPMLAKHVAHALMSLEAKHPANLSAHINGWTIAENYQPVHALMQELELGPYKDFHRIDLWKAVQAYWYWVGVAAVALLFFAGLSLRIMRLNDKLRLRSEALEASEERFRATFEQAAAAIVQLSADGHLLSFNRHLCELTGNSELQLRDTNLNALVHPEDLPSLLTTIERLRKNEIPAVTLELRLIRHDNTTQWVSMSASCIRGAEGGIKYLAGIFIDIEKRKRLERKLSDERAQKALVLDMAGDGILGLDSDGRHTFVNPAAARLLGYRVEEMLGRNSHTLWHHSHADGSDFPESECPITNVLRQGQVHRGTDATFWRADGSAFLVEYISTPIQENDDINGAVVVFRPIEHGDDTPGRREAS